MSRPLALIQLVGEQTMQNLLPVLRLHPVRLIHLATPRTRDRSHWIADAAGQAGVPTPMEPIMLASMPGMRETMQATLAAIERVSLAGEVPILNFTGGTKLMSIGAYVAALRHRCPSFYVDTQDSLFVDGLSAEGMPGLFAQDLGFDRLLDRLTLDVAAAANGCPRVSRGLDWQPWLPLARHLLENPEEEQACHAASQFDSQPRRASDWLRTLDRDFRLPKPVLDLALGSGLFRPGGTGDSARLPDACRNELTDLALLDGSGMVPGFLDRLFGAIAPLQVAINFLAGGWWEVVVAERLLQDVRFRDVRWSASVGERGGNELEEDVLALDGVRVAYVSCKRSAQGGRLLPQLEQIKARAERLGGSFNSRLLCVRHLPPGRTRENLGRRARELGIRLIGADELYDADPFG